jgi:outer membrane receptor protein involved in Fe transport
LALFAGPLAAQETGKIQGRVTDAASGQPIVGAQVAIVGSRLGNITNAEGFYFVNNVPADLLDIQAQYIGYQTVTVRQQRVLAGQTTTQNFQLAQAAVAIEGIDVIGETRPLVPRDQVGSKNIVTGDKIDELPVDNVIAIIRGQTGVVTTGNKSGFSIRGGRSGEEAVFVDGVLVRNFNSGDSNLTIGTNSLSELDVLTGGFGAEYGEAQSGIINYVTRSGGRTWNGTLSLQTDEIMPKEWSLGFNRAELAIGGPLIGNLGFFAAATGTGQKSIELGREWRDFPIYVAQGIDTIFPSDLGGGNERDVVIPNFVLYEEGGRIPFSNRDEYTLDSKLDFSYGSGSRIFITGKVSRDQRRNQFGGGRGWLYNSQGFAGQIQKSQTGIIGFTHNFVRSAESALALDVKVARQHDYFLSGNLDQQWDLDHRNPAFGFTVSDFKFFVDEDQFPVTDLLVERYLRNTPEGPDCTPCRLPFPETRTDLNGAVEYRTNPYGIITRFATRGQGAAMNYAEEWQWQYRATVDWQVNRQNRLKFGGEYFDIDISRFGVNNIISTFGAQLWKENPKRQALFVQDRLDLGDVVVEGGLRYDRFDPNSLFPVTPGYFNLDDPSSFTEAEVRESLSPRLGVSFPVTVNSTFRLNYGHFTQLPDLNEYYRGKNTDFFRFRNTNTNDLFNVGGLEMAKTVAFEFGYRQLLAPDFVLDISAFNRDKLKDVTVRKLSWADPTNPGATTFLNTFVNADFGTIRGIDLRLDRRFGQVLDATLGYSYQDARNTGTDPFTFTNVFARLESNANTLLGLPPNPAQAMRLTEENRKHNVSANMSIKFPATYHNKVLANAGLFMNFRALSGLPYSPLAEGAGNFFIAGDAGGAGLGVTGAILADDEISSARMPWQTFFNLKAQKGLRLMGWNAQVFVDARNILDLKTQTGIFQTTGDITDEEVYSTRIEAHRQTLGGGNIQDNIDLRSLSAAGTGVRNDVDLYMLQQTEARYGNGDMQFDAEEQIRAFRAAEFFLQGPQDLFGAGRRVRLGFELTF